MPLFKRRKNAKVCVIGLDGVPFTMLQELGRTGVMPWTGRLIASGSLQRMKASLPEISSVSWSDFMTGTDAGEHGIFGFTDFKPGSYEIRFPNFLDLKVPTLWDRLGEKGRRTIVINQPSTYPARKVNGILISGFVAIDLARAVWPASLKPTLDQCGYSVDIDSMKVRENPAFLWDELNKTLSGHQKALNLLWDEPWDYFEFVITGTDRLHHFLWSAWPDPNHPQHEAFLDYYRQVDRVIARIGMAFHKFAGSYEGLYLLSDHGFTGIAQEVYLNAWLEKNGYLSFETPEPKGLEDVAPKSKAFALDPNRIYLNLKGRFPKGRVERTARKELREEIAGKLRGLEHEGRKVVKRVFTAEEAYSGPLRAKGPDLVVVGEDGFDMKGSVKKKDVFGRTNLQGMHTWDDAFFWSMEGLGEDPAIRDAAPVILKNFL